MRKFHQVNKLFFIKYDVFMLLFRSLTAVAYARHTACKTFFAFTLVLSWYLSPLSAQDLFQINHFVEIKIQFIDKDWDTKLNTFKQQGLDNRLIATVWIDGTKYESCGVRYKGNSSYFNVRNAGLKKLPFNIKANEKNKEQFFPGGVSSLKLTNIFRDPSFVREVLAYEMAATYMHVPKANFARLYVNDEYYGIYTNTESIDERFLENHFGESSGTFFKCDPNWDAEQKQGCPPGEKASLIYLGPDSACYRAFYELESKHGWKNLIELTEMLNNQPEKIDSFINIQETLWMLAFSNVLVNLDSYIGKFCHNYYLYRDSSGLFRPMIWDLNLCFGGFPFDGVTPTPLPNDKQATLSLLIHMENAKRPLISKLLKNPTYRKMYIAHVRTIYKNYLEQQQYLKRANELVKLIDAEVNKDPQKLYSYESFRKNIRESTEVGKVIIPGITELMDARTTYIGNHPLVLKTPPEISNITAAKQSDRVVFNVKATEAITCNLYYRSGTHDRFSTLVFQDTGTDGDSVAGDLIYTCTIPDPGVSAYYIWAENEQAGAFYPENAGIGTFKVPE
jgi:hypothetical protein